MDIFSVLGERLKERRDAVGLTQLEAAEAAGVAQTYVSNLENGHNRPGVVSLLSNLANQYDTSLDYLFGRTEQKDFVTARQLSDAAQDILSLLQNLPEHRHDDLLALGDALLKEEKRRYAFWLVVHCDGCDRPMVGRIGANDVPFYVCDNEECEEESIGEDALISVVLATVKSLVDDVAPDAVTGATTDKSLLESIRSLGRRLGLLRARQQVQPTEVVDIVRDLLTHEDRSIPQAWLQAHFRLHVSGGDVSLVELL